MEIASNNHITDTFDAEYGEFGAIGVCSENSPISPNEP